MRLRRSLWLALAAAIAAAVATVTIPAYFGHLDAQAKADTNAAAKAIHLPGNARSCDKLRIHADHCSHTDGTARQAISDVARQFHSLGFNRVHTTCHPAYGKDPPSCIVMTERRGYTLAVAAHGHLLPEPPVRVRGLDVSVGVVSFN